MGEVAALEAKLERLTAIEAAARDVSQQRADYMRRTNNPEGTGCYITLAKALEDKS